MARKKWLIGRKPSVSCVNDSMIKILPSAIEDLHQGRLFYEKQQSELGEYFFNSLFSDIDSLLLYAGIHVEISRHYRLLSRRFPYAIYYKVEGEFIIVHRVLDLRQNPRKTEDALS